MQSPTRTLSLLLALGIAGCSGSPVSPASAGHTLSGTVTVPGGPPVEGVRLAAFSQTAITDVSGRYSMTLAENSMGSISNLFASKSGYEPRRLGNFSLTGGRVLNLTIAPVFRIPAGATAAFAMSSDEPSYPFFYDTADYLPPSPCSAPCRLIRVSAPIDRAGVVTITITARDAARLLQLFVDDGRPICCQREHVLESGLLANGEFVFYVRFSDGVPPGSDARIDIVTSFRAQ